MWLALIYSRIYKWIHQSYSGCKVKLPCFRMAPREGRTHERESPVLCISPTVVSLHCLDGKWRGPGHTTYRRASPGKRQRSCWSRRKPFPSSFFLNYPPPEAEPNDPKKRKTKKSVESKLYWPLNVPKVSSPRELGNKLASAKVSLLPSSGRSCVYATFLVSIFSRCGEPAFPATPVNSWYPSWEHLASKLRPFLSYF